MRAEITAVETAVMGVNQIRADIKGQKEAFDQLRILHNLHQRLDASELAAGLTEITRMGDTLFEATEFAFGEITDVTLRDDSDDSQPTREEASVSLEEQIDAILAKYNK